MNHDDYGKLDTRIDDLREAITVLTTALQQTETLIDTLQKLQVDTHARPVLAGSTQEISKLVGLLSAQEPSVNAAHRANGMAPRRRGDEIRQDWMNAARSRVSATDEDYEELSNRIDGLQLVLVILIAHIPNREKVMLAL